MQGAVRRSSARFAQAGFSLIELMVASTMGLFIMLAILMLFTNVSRTNDEMSKANALIENGRFAMQLLQNEIAHAGFWDVYIPDFDDLTFKGNFDVPDEAPDPCLDYASWPAAGTVDREDLERNLLGIVVQVHDSVPSGCSDLVTNRKSGTDILVVRHAETCIAGLAECESTGSDGRLYFQASRCEGEAGYALSTSGSTLHQRNCTSPVAKRRYVSNIYYIRNYSVTAGDNIPTLVRSEFDLDSGAVKAKNAVALIDGVEGFRVDLGIDRKSDAGIDIFSDSTAENHWTEKVKWANAKHLTSPVNRGDGVPDQFVHCSGVCSVRELANVVAVKLSLLVRSQTAAQGHVDSRTYTLGSQTFIPATADSKFKRHVFSTVVRLNNVSGRRETP